MSAATPVRPVDTRVRQQVWKILCPGAGFVVFGFGPSAAMPIWGGASALHPLRLTGYPSADSSAVITPRSEKWPGGEQLVQPPHQEQGVVVGRSQWSIDTRARHPKQGALPRSTARGWSR